MTEKELKSQRSHLDTELKGLKDSVIDMWSIVINQLTKVELLLAEKDKNLAKDVMAAEKRVDAFELKINMDSEDVLALFNPLAVDLRFVLSAIKINFELERIGDYAKGIAKIVDRQEEVFDSELVKEARIVEMLRMSASMLQEALEAFETDDVQKARALLLRDEEIDAINKDVDSHIAAWIERNPTKAMQALSLFQISKKIERVGDQTHNIAEEIIFHVEAIVLRHVKRKKIKKILGIDESTDEQDASTKE